MPLGDTLMAMTWNSLMDLMAIEFRRLRNIPGSGFGFFSAPATNPEELASEERASSQRIDSFVREFAKNRKWPTLSEKDRYFLRERIRFAFEYAGIASICLKCPARLAPRRAFKPLNARIIEYFLIETWRNGGMDNWLAPLWQMAENRQEQSVPKREVALAE
ncbi:MAG: hypothetical protein ACO1QB_17365 [Verrucomicrobiales bacterium]